MSGKGSERCAGVRVLLVDNYDSYTFNLFQLFAGLTHVLPTVVRNDTYDWDELERGDYDAIVISPGPGHPDRAGDFGVCLDIIRNATVPVLGVCLGHQGIAAAHGGQVQQAQEPMHGRVTAIRHGGDPLFAGIPVSFQATRYHSLAVREPLPANLDAIAWAGDGCVMALREQDRPVWGVQFHLESIGTPTGEALASNFLSAATVRSPHRTSSLRSVVPAMTPQRHGTSRAELSVRCLPGAADAERVFTMLFGALDYAFWLDSSLCDGGLARFSFLGKAGGPCGEIVSFDSATGETAVRSAANGTRRTYRMPILEYIDEQLARIETGTDLAFDFQGGFVGYLSYELKAIFGGAGPHRSQVPDAQFLLADRMVIVDHVEDETYTLALQPPGLPEAAAAWHEAAARAIRASGEVPPRDWPRGEDRVRFTLRRGREQYESDIRRCQELIREGESYEVCLTNAIHTTQRPDPLLTYRALRRLNPAPYAAFIRFGSLAVVSSSPERFLKVTRDRLVEAKPIKGTRRRVPDPEGDASLRDGLRASEKDRAENLMIVDLLRNDLGLVCEVGSVTVPALMAVESYATVHQLVSTVRGRLRNGVTLGECVGACFPGGSMTGAPKRRTMAIIDQLETGPRGVYSGALGFFAANGTADLSVVIRTIVFDARGVSVGAGGAITALSDPAEEFDEMILKATAPLEALSLAITGHRDRYEVVDPADSRAGAAPVAAG